MRLPVFDHQKTPIRPLQYRDLEEIATLAATHYGRADKNLVANLDKQLEQVRQWYGVLKFLKLFPTPLQYYFCIYVAEESQQVRGIIQVSPLNSSRSTWKVEWVIVAPQQSDSEILTGTKAIGSKLLRYCFESIWEARTWVLEVNVNDHKNLGLYRQNGFQPLAQITYWSLSPDILNKLAAHDPDLPNLLPVNNADAQLLYQLDTVSMPPLLRQVFDRHILDFKTNLLNGLINKVKNMFNHTEIKSGYVFEPQRKAAIGYFKLEISQDGSKPHLADLTVHPAYTWLYPKLLAHMAQQVQGYPHQSLELTSADYQPEREEYLEKLGTQRHEHTLLMSRSVWHKLKESKPLEGLQLTDMLQGFNPARTPIPSRISWLMQLPTHTNKEMSTSNQSSPKEELSPSEDSSKNTHQA